MTRALEQLRAGQVDCYGPSCGRIFGRIVTVEILGWLEAC